MLAVYIFINKLLYVLMAVLQGLKVCKHVDMTDVHLNSCNSLLTLYKCSILSLPHRNVLNIVIWTLGFIILCAMQFRVWIYYRTLMLSHRSTFSANKWSTIIPASVLTVTSNAMIDTLKNLGDPTTIAGSTLCYMGVNMRQLGVLLVTQPCDKKDSLPTSTPARITCLNTF